MLRTRREVLTFVRREIFLFPLRANLCPTDLNHLSNDTKVLGKKHGEIT